MGQQIASRVVGGEGRLIDPHVLGPKGLPALVDSGLPPRQQAADCQDQACQSDSGKGVLLLHGLEGGREQRDGADDGEVLPMIGHPRVTRQADFKQSQHWQKHQYKITEGKQQRLAPTLPEAPKQGKQTNQQHCRKIRERLSGSSAAR